MVCGALNGQPLDLLITDHALPQTTGRELAERIVKSCPNAKVLQVAALPFTRMQEEDALLPGSAFLQKPFTGGQLIGAVQGILAARTQ